MSIELTTTPPKELTTYDLKTRASKTIMALHLGTVIAIVLAVLGVEPVACAMIPSGVVCIPTAVWEWRDRRDRKRRRAARESALREGTP